MSKVEQCGNCRFMVKRGKDRELAECHRNPPVRHAPTTGKGWPCVTPVDWCGQWAGTQPKDDRRIRSYLLDPIKDAG